MPRQASTLREGELRITLPNGASGRQFDGSGHGHELSHCMKAVDWVVELSDHIRFIELKDPDAQRAAAHQDRHEFLSRNLTPALTSKFRDSFLYEWACRRVGKPISYFVVIASKSLDKTALMTRSEALKRQLPSGKPQSWQRPMAHACGVFNIETWNASFPDWHLERVPEGSN